MKNSDRQNRATKAFVQNGPVIFDISGGGKILRGWIRLHGTLNITAVGAAGTKIGAGGPVRLIKRIRVDLNALDPRYASGRCVDIYPESLLQFAVPRNRGAYQGDQLGTTFGGAGAAIGNYTVETWIPIYWADPLLKRSVETSLNGDAYESIQVRIDCADLSNVFAGENTTLDAAGYNNLQIDWVDDRENFAGDTITVFQEDHDFQIPAANKRALDLAMPKDGGFLEWNLLALNTTNETYSDAILNKLRINGDSLDFEKYSPDIRQQMFNDGGWSPLQTATGRYRIDFTDHLIGGNIAAALLSFYFDVNNPGGANQDTLRFVTRRVFPPVGYAPKAGKGTAQNQ